MPKGPYKTYLFPNSTATVPRTTKYRKKTFLKELKTKKNISCQNQNINNQVSNVSVKFKSY